MTPARGTIWQRCSPIFLAAVIVWINAYVARELFVVETTAQMNSMQGFWAAMARLAGDSWWTSNWWPFWDGGMPFEYTYAPLFPGLSALTAAVSGRSALHSVHVVTGIVYCLGPAILFLCCWRLTGSAAWSFAAGVAYSLLSPALLLAPNEGFAFNNLLRAERLYLMGVWDEAPHMTALALWPAAVLGLFRIAETGRARWIGGGVLLMAAMVYASAFGATLLVITAVCVIASRRPGLAGIFRIAIAGALTYLAACIALPPSLIGVIQDAAKLHGHGWSERSWTALAACGVAWTLAVPVLHARVREAWMRFFALFSLTSLLIVWLFEYGGRQFIPQPGRYKQELSAGLAVAAVFAARAWTRRLPRRVQWSLLVLAVALAGEQTVSYRKWAKVGLWGRDLAPTIESRAARWADEHLPRDARILFSGSMGQWLNVFSDRHQWTGSSWATAPNNAQQQALQSVLTEQGSVSGSLTWFRVFGVQAVAVGGPASPEVWKPFTDKTKYDGAFEVLWREDDTTLYRVPGISPSLAHALPSSARPSARDVRPYAEALEHERAPGLRFEWLDRNHARVSGEVRRGEAVSIQINHHAGWEATVNGRASAIGRDGTGQMWIEPQCDGECRIDLAYGGGIELNACRWISAVTLLGMAGLFLRRSRATELERREVAG